jgi:hypothetical protein
MADGILSWVVSTPNVLVFTREELAEAVLRFEVEEELKRRAQLPYDAIDSGG